MSSLKPVACSCPNVTPLLGWGDWCNVCSTREDNTVQQSDSHIHRQHVIACIGVGDHKTMACIVLRSVNLTGIKRGVRIAVPLHCGSAERAVLHMYPHLRWYDWRASCRSDYESRLFHKAQPTSAVGYVPMWRGSCTGRCNKWYRFRTFSPPGTGGRILSTAATGHGVRPLVAAHITAQYDPPLPPSPVLQSAG